MSASAPASLFQSPPPDASALRYPFRDSLRRGFSVRSEYLHVPFQRLGPRVEADFILTEPLARVLPILRRLKRSVPALSLF
jgi:hypothetical protein